jgi:hypothetical protein
VLVCSLTGCGAFFSSRTQSVDSLGVAVQDQLDRLSLKAEFY